MAARAGIEPGPALWRSSANIVPVIGYKSKELSGMPDCYLPSGELFTSYSPGMILWKNSGGHDDGKDRVGLGRN